MASVRSALITVMIGAAEKAGRAIIRDFGEVEQLQVSRKGPSDFVTNADLKAEKLLKAELSHARPRFGLVFEESARQAGEPGQPDWVVDPLDGTTNFLHGLPHWAISIAAVLDGEPIAGVVHDPVADETFWAEKGVGAFLNYRRLRVSARRDLHDALVATGIPARGHGDHQAFLAQIGRAMSGTASIRRTGSAALDLAYVAAGRLDGFWESGLQAWDIAAGAVLIREAGGAVGTVSGKGNPLETGDILAANAELSEPLRRLIAG